jgi:protein-S-isoprenylcysteine O-methyltransferase Ste14
MKMSTYVWGIIVFLIGLLVLFVGIGLYFAKGDDLDYKKNWQDIVWSLVIVGIIILILGILLFVWGAFDKENIKVSRRQRIQLTQ